MQIDCVRITFESEELVTCKTTQQIDDAAVVEKWKCSERPLYLFANEHLEVLCQHVDVVIDKVEKHKGKPLTDYFAYKDKKKLEKIPLLRTNYKSKTRAINGIRDLFKNIEGRDTINAFIVGVEKVIFDEVWEKAKKVAATFSRPISTPSCKVAKGMPFDSTERRIFKQLEGIHSIPPELEKEYIGDSDATKLTRAFIMAAAKCEEPVLILGNTGTGKEVIARAIHNHSSRKCDDHKMISVNCSAIPTEFLEYELFGSEAGIVGKGEHPLKIGYWELAGKGTLFLDEIGDLSLDHQAKILRVLESRKFRRMGGNEEIDAEARVLTATNRNLFSMVQTNEYREDLYYRLRGTFVYTSPLKDRLDDIPVLACYFWKKITKNETVSLSDDVLEELCRYPWPGNVRELKMLLTQLYTLLKNLNPSVTNLKDIFSIEHQIFSIDTYKPVSKDEISLQRTRCLQHLKRVDEVIHLCHYKFKGSLLEDIKNMEPLSSIRESLLFLNHEIELLCNKPTLFHGKEIFSTVYDFKGKISYLLSLLTLDHKSATEFIETDIISALDSLLLMISHEIDKIMSKG